MPVPSPVLALLRRDTPRQSPQRGQDPLSWPSCGATRRKNRRSAAKTGWQELNR
jgi:hypothetical protein